jgi:hypothetical protein
VWVSAGVFNCCVFGIILWYGAAGLVNPLQVAERAIVAIAAAKACGLGWFVSSDEQQIRTQAAASSQRWAAGNPLSPLDGMFSAVLLLCTGCECWRPHVIRVIHAWSLFDESIGILSQSPVSFCSRTSSDDSQVWLEGKAE